jgi:hypothetical protein
VEWGVVKINMEEELKDHIEVAVDIRNKTIINISIKDNSKTQLNLSWEELVCNNNQIYSRI